MLVIEGGLMIDEFSGGFSLRTRRVSTLSEVCERQARLLRVKLNGVDAAFSARLRSLLAGHIGGKTPLRLSYKNAQGQAELELGAEWRVRASVDLKRSIDALPGVLASELVLAKPAPAA